MCFKFFFFIVMTKTGAVFVLCSCAISNIVFRNISFKLPLDCGSNFCVLFLH